jgi:hypothetical protein
VRALAHLDATRIRGVVFNDYRELITSVYKYSQRKYGGDF